MYISCSSAPAIFRNLLVALITTAVICYVTIDVGICNFKVIGYIYLPIFKHEKQLFFVNATFFKIGTKYNPSRNKTKSDSQQMWSQYLLISYRLS